MNAGVVRSNDILGGTRNHPALGNDGVFVGMERCSSLLSLDECSSCRGDVLAGEMFAEGSRKRFGKALSDSEVGQMTNL